MAIHFDPYDHDQAAYCSTTYRQVLLLYTDYHCFMKLAHIHQILGNFHVKFVRPYDFFSSYTANAMQKNSTAISWIRPRYDPFRSQKNFLPLSFLISLRYLIYGVLTDPLSQSHNLLFMSFTVRSATAWALTSALYHTSL